MKFLTREAVILLTPLLLRSHLETQNTSYLIYLWNMDGAWLTSRTVYSAEHFTQVRRNSMPKTTYIISNIKSSMYALLCSNTLVVVSFRVSNTVYYINLIY